MTLRRMGFYLGKFIYLLDAYDDVEKDVKSGNYNPFSEKYKMKGFDGQVQPASDHDDGTDLQRI